MKYSLKNVGLVVAPLLILLGSATYIGYNINNQNRILNDAAFVIQNSQPVVVSRADLENRFNEYISASGLKVDDQNRQELTNTNSSSNKDFSPSGNTDRIYGNPNAQFYIIEYSDFECPYCKEHFPQLLDLVDSSSGNIALVFKHVPVHGQASQVESMAAECAVEQNGNPGFYKLARAIFKNTQSNGNGLTVPLDVLAERNGLDGKRLLDCVNSGRPSKKIGDDVHEAAGLQIQQTPSTIVVHGDNSAMVQGMVNGTGIMQMMAQLVGGGTAQKKQ